MTEKKLKKQYCVDFKSLDFTSKEAKKKLEKNSICIIKNIVHKKDVNFLVKCFCVTCMVLQRLVNFYWIKNIFICTQFEIQF